MLSRKKFVSLWPTTCPVIECNYEHKLAELIDGWVECKYLKMSTVGQVFWALFLGWSLNCAECTVSILFWVYRFWRQPSANQSLAIHVRICICAANLCCVCFESKIGLFLEFSDPQTAVIQWPRKNGLCLPVFCILFFTNRLLTLLPYTVQSKFNANEQK